MKKWVLIIFIISGLINIVNGQVRASLYAGYGFSQFDDLEFAGGTAGQTGYVPAGVNIEYGGNMFAVGIEATYSFMPFIFDLEAESYGKVGETEITQLSAGGFVKVRFRNKNEINPFVRAGLAYYGGISRITFTDEFKQTINDTEDSEDDLVAAIGFNAGIGMDFPLSQVSFIYFEGIYHFVQRKYDIPNAESFRANSFAFFLGFTHSF